ncbi:conserved hypothetical protein [Thiomonas sp. X19]|uniref:hypothetical protein n=1 Tax=Thiomonas sp. X19 TaxID=1050370 RepID=UPI000B6A61F2|nr:hypothetical protein [Thiomonas sp. X19]SCC92495.1 conserved hypothetical protein [Thiomonas sp. X19]
MHIKHRRARALLYRSVWVPKGSAGNTHGYSRQAYVGSLPVATEAIPAALRERLSDAERAFIDAKICGPAREAAERQRVEDEVRERDPGWRLEEAQRLVREAAARSAGMPVSATRLGALQDALSGVKTDGSAIQMPTNAKGTDDPLRSALAAVQEAARAVATGRYGNAPAEQVRSTKTYRLWADFWEATQGEGEASLLRALQAKGFVKRRGR